MLRTDTSPNMVALSNYTVVIKLTFEEALPKARPEQQRTKGESP